MGIHGEIQGWIQAKSVESYLVHQNNFKQEGYVDSLVDAIIITGDDSVEIERLKKLLAREFGTKDLINLRYFLGMKVARSKEGIMFNQRKYTLDLLSETRMMRCKPAETPMHANLKLKREELGSPYCESIYERSKRRTFGDHELNPEILEIDTGHGLIFRKSKDRTVKIFSVSSWAGELTDRISTTDYCSFVWGNLVTWRSKKWVVVS
ncbi:uncharacterized mitochondrial protein AtMg00810-like [Hibiscus syriacus]|uniref:uncharacterized mitochondrial protein AtMg00810-like n=1 Tax=Hibiscus syriacus TaxID=106335 RepID=UPI00192124ED|nr:uncharacterized mitochondrial protein AtMg00810-like [Hibiscus syriacus]